MAVKVFITNVRGAFLKLGDPEQYQNAGAFRWSATGLVRKTDTKQIKRVEDALMEVCVEKWGPKAKAAYASIMGDKNKCAWLDGDKSTNDGYEGCMSLAAHRYAEKGRPLVYDSDKSPIYAADNSLYPGKGGRLPSGFYVNMEVELWAQDNKHGKALRATLLGIQRFAVGDAFGGGSQPDPESFGEIEEGASADDIS